MSLFFQLCWAITVVVAVLPVVFFLLFGWPAREAEFLGKVRVGAAGHGADGREMRGYFEKFWSRGWADYLDRHPEDASVLAGRPAAPTYWGAVQVGGAQAGGAQVGGAQVGGAEAVARAQRDLMRRAFRTRYRQVIGRTRYLPPLALFMVVVAILSGLVVASAVRLGYDQYIRDLIDEVTRDAAAKLQVAHEIAVDREEQAALVGAVLPVPSIGLSMSSLAAISGAYLFLVTQLIQQCRARTLVYSDLFGASLRMLLAVPVGLSMGAVGPSRAAPFVAFALGAFPIRELNAVVRRLVGKFLSFDPRADDDQTTAMLGVTQSVADVLADENITCAQQLADIDPVVLAVRTGLSFDYVLFLAAQSLVWCFLGRTACRLGPLGYGDARAIWFLMASDGATEARRGEVLAALAAQMVRPGTTAEAGSGRAKAVDVSALPCTDATLLRQAFTKIALDPYTVFLVEFTSDLRRRHGPAPLVLEGLLDGG